MRIVNTTIHVSIVREMQVHVLPLKETKSPTALDIIGTSNKLPNFVTSFNNR